MSSHGRTEVDAVGEVERRVGDDGRTGQRHTDGRRAMEQRREDVAEQDRDAHRDAGQRQEATEPPERDDRKGEDDREDHEWRAALDVGEREAFVVGQVRAAIVHDDLVAHTQLRCGGVGVHRGLEGRRCTFGRAGGDLERHRVAVRRGVRGARGDDCVCDGGVGLIVEDQIAVLDVDVTAEPSDHETDERGDRHNDNDADERVPHGL